MCANKVQCDAPAVCFTGPVILEGAEGDNLDSLRTPTKYQPPTEEITPVKESMATETGWWANWANARAGQVDKAKDCRTTYSEHSPDPLPREQK